MKKSLNSNLLLGAFILGAAFAASSPSQAYDHGWGDRGWGDHGWHGRFTGYDMDRWHGGFWANRFHDGRNGWWWVVGDQYYYYPAPVYPYPNPYVPPVVVAQPGLAGQQYWYCANPAGFYPYVPQCFTAWQPSASYNAPPVAAAAPAPYVAPAPVAAPIPPSADRDSDDRQLNAFAVELSGILTTAPDAKVHIGDLQNRVESFRQALFTRGYNAMDILKDTESLQKRIAKQKSRIYSAQ